MDARATRRGPPPSLWPRADRRQRTSAAIVVFNVALTFRWAGAPDDEEAVLSVGGCLRDGRVALTVDISRGEGFVLAEGPGVEFAFVDLERERPKLLAPWLTELRMWLYGFSVVSGPIPGIA